MAMTLVVLVILVVLVLILFFTGYRFLALLLLLFLLGLWAYTRAERRTAVQGLPSAPVVLPTNGSLYPDGHDGSKAIIH